MGALQSLIVGTTCSFAPSTLNAAFGGTLNLIFNPQACQNDKASCDATTQFNQCQTKENQKFTTWIVVAVVVVVVVIVIIIGVSLIKKKISAKFIGDSVAKAMNGPMFKTNTSVGYAHGLLTKKVQMPMSTEFRPAEFKFLPLPQYTAPSETGPSSPSVFARPVNISDPEIQPTKPSKFGVLKRKPMTIDEAKAKFADTLRSARKTFNGPEGKRRKLEVLQKLQHDILKHHHKTDTLNTEAFWK